MYGEFQPLVRRLIRQYGEDPELRQDLEDEIYCRFCRLLEQYDANRSIPLKAHLIRTLPSSVYSFAHSQWRQRREHGGSPVREQAPSGPMTDPLGAWEARALLWAIPAAIGQLPLQQRRVVIWRYYEGHAFAQIAARLGVQPATARSLLRRGLNDLRHRLFAAANLG